MIFLRQCLLLKYKNNNATVVDVNDIMKDNKMKKCEQQTKASWDETSTVQNRSWFLAYFINWANKIKVFGYGIRHSKNLNGLLLFFLSGQPKENKYMYNDDPSLQYSSEIIHRHLHENTKISTKKAKFCCHLKYFVLLTLLILKKSVVVCLSCSSARPYSLFASTWIIMATGKC